MKPKADPARMDGSLLEERDFVVRDTGAALANEAARFQFAFEKKVRVVPISAHSIFATAIRANSVKNIELLGVEIDAVNTIGISRFSASERIG